MLSAQFFRFFWLTFIAIMALLGVAIAMLAGSLLARGDLAGTATAVALTAACALLCGIAEDTRRALRDVR